MTGRRKVIPIDEGWVFKQADDEGRQFLAVSQFPTNVHLDLMHHGLIPDPFIGTNENNVQWVGEKAWVYKTSFTSPVINDGERAVLVFEGLDTYATVRLNGGEILKTEDMFIPERVEVTNLLRTSANLNFLEITFESAFLIGKGMLEKYPDHHWGCWNGDPSRLAVRKAQYHYGWDWGPTLLTCGPWRPINLELYSSRISDLHFRTDVHKSLKRAEVVVKAEIEGGAKGVIFEISLDGKKKASERTEVVDGLATITFHIQEPQLWYPARYGNQPLYQLTAYLTSNGVELDSCSKRLGLRRAQLIQRELHDGPGKTFFFEINNVPIFCGGSNWIPADNFIPRIKPEKYRAWLNLVAKGSQMMVRVWGGGLYEEQIFYETCDELGLLIWHDFMFACGNYPAYPEFLNLVKREATVNVKRLRHHPSIVIWAGNNEDYQYCESEGLEWCPEDLNPDNWLETTFPARYIYEKILADVTKELVPDTYYHFGSPYGGGSTRDPTVGDIHQWNVWHGTQERYQDYDKLVGRFVSEFGMEAFPNIETVDSFLPWGMEDPDRYSQSLTVDFHNKAAGHERRLATYLVENLQYKFEPLEQYIYCTQLMQSECLSTAYRLWKRDWKGPGQEYCAGALVWQINDCWPVISWAVVDHYLRPKLAYYSIKRELAPVTIGLKRVTRQGTVDGSYSTTTHEIEMWASNLTAQTRTVEVLLRAWNVDTGKEIYSKKLHERFDLKQNRSVEVTKFKVPVEKEGRNEELRTVVAAYLLEDGNKQIARYVNWPEPLKYLNLKKPQRLTVWLSGDATQVGLSAEIPVKGAALYSKLEGVVFDDNCIDLVPGETVHVGVKGLQKDQGDQLTVRFLGL